MNIFETSYTEYLTAKKSGLRREAMTALNTFLAACGNVDTASKRQIVKDFFTNQSADDIEFACSFPLNSRLLFPVLTEWCAENPAQGWIWRSLAYLARTLKLANLAPDIVKLIWENRQPETLTLDKLRRGIPESWEEQRKLFLS